jgi:hypothetical protein
MARMAVAPLFLLLVVFAPPRDLPGSPASHIASPLSVLQFSWRQQHILPSLFSPGFSRADVGRVAPGAGLPQPLSGDSSTSTGLRRRRLPVALDPPIIVSPVAESTERVWYWYSVKVRNLAPLPIQTVVWDYVFRDPGSGAIQGVVQVRSEEKIKPGKSKTLEGITVRPPANVASVATLKDKRHEGESIEIVEVVFSDHSVWHPPTVSQ